MHSTQREKSRQSRQAVVSQVQNLKTILEKRLVFWQPLEHRLSFIDAPLLRDRHLDSVPCGRTLHLHIGHDQPTGSTGPADQPAGAIGTSVGGRGNGLNAPEARAESRRVDVNSERGSAGEALEATSISVPIPAILRNSRAPRRSGKAACFPGLDRTFEPSLFTRRMQQTRLIP
jgi:hypothetical protein